MKKKIVTIVGARPQFIKVAPVSKELRKYHTEILVHTGQHFDIEMSDVFFEELSIPKPDYHLGISGGTHGSMTAKMLEKIEEIFIQERPDLVLLYGDTNSTLAAALAASKLHLPIAHIESGPRTYDRHQPEEVNRVFTDYVSALRFCPTFQSLENLKLEGMEENSFHVGDVMYDSALYARKKASNSSKILESLNLTSGSYAVATIHRAEHTQDRQILNKILDFLKTQDTSVVFPMHPRTRQAIQFYNLSLDGLIVINPLGYLDMTWLTVNAAQVITDSGGLPKEAYFHQVPCITIGGYTPWPETIAAGWNRLWSKTSYVMPRSSIPDYGSGDASRKIVETLNVFLSKPKI